MCNIDALTYCISYRFRSTELGLVGCYDVENATQFLPILLFPLREKPSRP